MAGEKRSESKFVNARVVVGVTLAAMLVAAYFNWPQPSLSNRLAEWKSAGKYFKFKNYYQIFYIDETGQGSKDSQLLLLHGFPTSSFDWSKVLERLKERFGRIIAPDLLGFGFSDKPIDHNYTIFEQADVVRALLRHLDVSKVHLLSHDYGDTVAQELLYRNVHHKSEDENQKPIEIQTACLLNGGVFPELHVPRWSQTILLHPYLGKLLSKLSNYWLFSRELASTFGTDTKPSDADLQDWWTLVRLKDGHNVLPLILHYIPQRRQNRDRWISALKDSSEKVHFIYGPLDPINPEPFAQHFREVFSPATLESLPNVGHYVQWEAPDQMIRSYFKFLDNYERSKQATMSGPSTGHLLSTSPDI